MFQIAVKSFNRDVSNLSKISVRLPVCPYSNHIHIELILQTSAVTNKVYKYFYLCNKIQLKITPKVNIVIHCTPTLLLPTQVFHYLQLVTHRLPITPIGTES